MAGYTRQSAAQIISGEVVSASPLNAEFNQVLAAFNNASGHKHDGTASEGPPIDRVADADQKNAILVDSSNNELEFYVEQNGAAEKQLSIKHQIIEPTTDNDVDLGGVSNAFRNAYINSLNVTGGTLTGANVDINGGTIDGTVIGSTTPANITGATVTANQFSGPLSGAVTGNVNGAVTGTLSGAVTDTTQSEFNDVIINGSLNMNAGTTATVTGLSAPSQGSDAATKTYVDTEISNLVGTAPAILDTLGEIATSLGNSTNLASTLTTSIGEKLPLAGGTMTGNITMSQSSTVTGLPTPSAGSDAANKTYADTKLSSTNPQVASGALTLTGAPTQANHAATKDYVDTVMSGTNNVSQSAQNAANSAADAQKLAINPENSQFTLADGVTTGFSALHHAAKAEDSATAAASSFDSFDDRYLGAKSSTPATDNDGDALLTGALYYDTTASEMRVYDGNSWAAAGSAVNGTSSRQVYVATANQTTFTITYDVGFVDVYLNGLKLRVGTDFTATTGTNIVLASGANLGDIVDIVAYGAFNVANTYTQAAADARYTRISNSLSELTGSASTARANIGAAPTASPTFTGTVTIPASSLTYAGTSVTATGAELNKLAGATASTAELNFVTGVTSAIQTQLDAKAPLASPNFSGTPQISGSNILTAATAPAGGNVVEAVASGTLADGSAVILQSDGTVKVPTGVAGGELSKQTIQATNSTLITGSCFHTVQNKVVISYSDNTNSTHGKLVAGTVSGDTITFGTPITFNAGYTNNSSLAYHAQADRIVVVYEDSVSQYGTFKTYSLSGTTFTASVGATRLNSTESMGNMVCQYDPDQQCVVVFWRRISVGNAGGVMALTITSNSAGTNAIGNYGNGVVTQNKCAYNTALDHHLVIYKDSNNNSYLHYSVYTASGTTLSRHTEGLIYSGTADQHDLGYDPDSDRMLVIASISGLNSEAHIIVGTASGNSYGWTTPSANTSRVSLFQELAQGCQIIHNPDTQQMICIYQGTDNAGSTFAQDGRIVAVTVSGTTITAGTPQTWNTGYIDQIAPVYDTNADRLAVAYRDQANSNHIFGSILKLSSTDLTTSNFLGFSNGVYTNGQTATIQTTGNVDDAQSNLVIASTYFVQNDGTLSTTPSPLVTVKAGKAISATKILIADVT